MLNGLQCTPRGGQLSVIVTVIRGGTQLVNYPNSISLRRVGGMLAGVDRVCIDVTDNGNGISEVSCNQTPRNAAVILSTFKYTFVRKTNYDYSKG